MLFNIQIIFIGVACIALLLLYLLRWRDYTLPQRRKCQQEALKEERPKISIIIPVSKEAALLEQNLPYFLEQQFPSFEVVVVNIASNAETSDVLKRLEAKYKNLRHTFVPKTSRYIDRQKLALTLGIRAAHSEWCVLTAPDCRPASNLWLATMTQNLKPITIGYGNYIDDGSNLARCAIYERLCAQLRVLRAGFQGKACGADGTNLIISKQLFLDNQGFAGSLELPFGSCALLVDQLATEENVCFVWDTKATMLQELPSTLILHNEKMYLAELRKHLSKNAYWWALREAFASWAFYIFLFTEAVYIASRIYESTTAEAYKLTHLFTDIPSLLLLMCWMITPIILFRQLTKQLELRKYGVLLHHYALLQPFRTFINKIRSLKHQEDFIRPIV
ncbi:hypothetical protein HMPREF9332_00312 [Alloprevotella rava F0323]|uniref:Glycosyltransferase 2-like domain-containing protein n=1 Tax=Alloprevotella rava F0323 TaxID=679199 RepID=G5G9R1_9BACT|nr:glycosyltransferase [Alloprevotella rava]EHG24111.1 hypothetical protein HMPREF9332_00312 [Alloprevotella rava F0323]